MLYPSMNELLKKVNNRYMLVNLAAKRARDIADDAEENETPLLEKPVKTALNDIMAGRIVLIEREPGEEESELGDEVLTEIVQGVGQPVAEQEEE